MWGQNNGMHWRDAKNPRLYSLARQEAANDNWVGFSEDEDLDIEDRHDGTINAIFGSTGATIQLRAVTPDGAATAFLHSACGMLAFALHERTGLPFRLFTSKDTSSEGWSGHVALAVGDNQVLDILGVRDVAEVLSDFHTTTDEGVITREQFLEIVVGEEHRADPMGYLCELEQLITEDFADWLLEENPNVKRISK